MPPRHRSEREHPDRTRVLLVDTDDAARVRTTYALSEAGLEVVAAVANHAQAILGARDHQPDVIVTGLDGGQFLAPDQYIGALRRKAPLAAVVLYASVIPSGVEAKAWGAVATLAKPAEREQLGDAVRAAHKAVCHACH
jgi:DNA-binding NarL/FixJ family response regulator